MVQDLDGALQEKHYLCQYQTMLYMEIYRMHISPVLGKVKLLDITQLQILQLLKKMDAKGLQFESRNKVRILLQDMFDKAMINDILYKKPSKGIKLGAYEGSLNQARSYSKNRKNLIKKLILSIEIRV